MPLNNKKFLMPLALFFSCNLAQAAGNSTVPTASFREPSQTADHPYSSTLSQQVPVDLAPLGFVEREYFMQGTASVYSFQGIPSANNVQVAASDLPYVNRILVRAPSDPAGFSGNVVVEIINDNTGSDIPAVWPQSYRHFVHNGDIWIGITSAPTGSEALKRYSPSRYGELQWPVWSGSCGEGQREEGAIYDMVTALAQAVRSNSGDIAANPLAGYNVQHLYLTGYSQGAHATQTYRWAIAPQSDLFDAYVPVAGAFSHEPINSCSSVSAELPLTLLPRPTKPVVVQVQTASEVQLARAAPIPQLQIVSQPDSNIAGFRYRLYEIAGSSHLDQHLFDSMPNTDDLVRANSVLFDTEALKRECYSDAIALVPGAVPNTFDSTIAYNAIWQNLEDWVRDGTPPPHTLPIGSFDYFDLARTGWRTPEIDLPSKAYLPGSPEVTVVRTIVSSLGAKIDGGGTCWNLGLTVPYPSLAERWKSTYPTSEIFHYAYLADVDLLQRLRFITTYDADYLRMHWSDQLVR